MMPMHRRNVEFDDKIPHGKVIIDDSLIFQLIAIELFVLQYPSPFTVTSNSASFVTARIDGCHDTVRIVGDTTWSVNELELCCPSIFSEIERVFVFP